MDFKRFVFSRTYLSLAMAVLVACYAGADEADDKASDLDAPTHRQVRMLLPKVDGATTRLTTIAPTSDGYVLAALNGSANYLQMLDSEGEVVKQWELELSPTAVTCAPDGSIYVGGSGQVAKLDRDSDSITMIDSPHVGDLEELKEKTRESLQKSAARMRTVYETQIVTIKARIAKIEDKEEDDRSSLEKAQIKGYQRQLESYQRMLKSMESAEPAKVSDAQVTAAMNRALSITSMAASDQDLFICATDPARGGYSIWRVSADLDTETTTHLMDGLRGCCGQMDIQCCQGKLVISENTNFKIGIYDRDGKSETKFGARDRTSRAGFGGCCNPMNALAMSDGTILTAESSIGHIKRFDTEGNLVAYIGKAVIAGGCKHCALAYDEQNDLYYMMSQDKSGICVLANRENAPQTVAEKKLEQQQTEFLSRVAGQWATVDEANKAKNTDDAKVNSALGSTLAKLLGQTQTSRARIAKVQHPISSLTLQANGAAKILEGRYKAYGETTQLELTKPSSEKDTYNVAFAFDQVRYLEGTWTFTADDIAQVNFDHLPAVTLTRTATAEACDSECAGANCTNENCQDPNCPRAKTAATEQTDVVITAIADVDVTEDAEYTELLSEVTEETELIDLPDLVFTKASSVRTVPSPKKFAYKVLNKKDIQGNLQETLTKMGDDGWDFVARVGKDLVFKRVVVGDVTEAK